MGLWKRIGRRAFCRKTNQLTQTDTKSLLVQSAEFIDYGTQTSSDNFLSAETKTPSLSPTKFSQATEAPSDNNFYTCADETRTHDERLAVLVHRPVKTSSTPNQVPKLETTTAENKQDPLQMPIFAPLPIRPTARMRSRSRARTLAGAQMEIHRRQEIANDLPTPQKYSSKSLKERFQQKSTPRLTLLQNQSNKNNYRINLSNSNVVAKPSFIAPLHETIQKLADATALTEQNTQTSTSLTPPKDEKLISLSLTTEEARQPATALSSSSTPPLSLPPPPPPSVSTPIKRSNQEPSLPPPPPPPEFLLSNIRKAPVGASLSVGRTPMNRAKFAGIPERRKSTVRAWGAFLDKRETAIKSTIWEDFNTPEVNTALYQLIEDNFVEKRPTAHAQIKSSKPIVFQSPVGVQTLQIRNAFFLSMAVKNFKCSKEELIRRIEEADWDKNEVHQWKTLKEFLPTTDELEQFKNLTVTEGLDDSHKFCILAAKKTELSRKVTCVYLAAQIPEKLVDLEKASSKLNDIIGAIKLFQSHAVFIKRIMYDVLRMVNFLNQGTTSEFAPGFQLISLVKFLEMKGAGRTLAWFIARQNVDACTQLPFINEKLKLVSLIEVDSVKEETEEAKKIIKVLTEFSLVWRKERPDIYEKVVEYGKTLSTAAEKLEQGLDELKIIETQLKAHFCAADLNLAQICSHFQTAFALLIKEKENCFPN